MQDMIDQTMPAAPKQIIQSLSLYHILVVALSI